MPHDFLLQAAIDEVDQALAGLQTTRQILRELQRTSQLLQRSGLLPGSPDRAAQQHRSAGLRYSGMTVAEAARALSLSDEHVRRLLRRGELEGFSFGGRVGWRLNREYVMGLTAAREATAPTGQLVRAPASPTPPTGAPDRVEG